MKIGLYLLSLLLFIFSDVIVQNESSILCNNSHQITYQGCHGDGYNLTIDGIIYNENNPIDTITLMNTSGCDSIIYISLEFGMPIEAVGVQKTNLSQLASNDGMIHFEFEDEPNIDSLEISVDGGLTFPYIVSDSIGTFVINNLPADTFHIKARAKSSSCQLELGTLILIPDPCGTYQINEQPNILFIVADDFGLETAPFSDLASQKANMPNIMNLASQGLIFDNAWSTPFCAPTRAGIITGRHGFRTGVLSIPTHNTLRLDETTIQKYIDTEFPNTYEQAIIGKWHLNNEIVDFTYPAQMGIPHFDGLRRGSTGSYYNWKRQTNGIVESWNQYITTAITDFSLQWIENQGDQPWHLWLTHVAPHTPFHKPPNHLHDRDSLPNTAEDILENPVPYYISMLESMDQEIGRLLDNMCPNVKENTIIIFISDNGTPAAALQSPYKKGKGTFFQGGINVPMIVAGKGVTRIGERDSTLVNTTDLFATFAAIAGSDSTQIHDSKSLLPLFSQADTVRHLNYSNLISGWTVSENGYKYFHKFDGKHHLYNLLNDPYEYQNLYYTSNIDLLNIINDLNYKGREIRGELCLDNIYPNISINSFDETIQGADNGNLLLTITNEPTKGNIEFSIDGITYPYIFPDSIGTYNITDLKPKTYLLHARWENDDCPIFLDSIQIMSACNTDHPIASIEIKHESNFDTRDGKIIFSYLDNPNKHKIEFSLDGGFHYPFNVSDSSGSYTISDLAPNIYTIWERWGNNDCPNYLGTYEVLEFESCESDYPRGNVSTQDISIAGANDGSIHIDFDDNPNYDNIQFSINGGITYPFTTYDSIGYYDIQNLSFGSYNIKARWKDKACPIFLDRIQIHEPCNSLTPIVKTYKTDASSFFENDGSLQFSFVDIPSKGKIEFSIDGGKTFPYKTHISSGQISIDSLFSRRYDTWARWGNNECPIFLETIFINSSCTDSTPPSITITSFNESINGGNDGSIQVDILNNPNLLDFEISIDGGKTFPYTLAGNTSQFTIQNLVHRIYNLHFRYKNYNQCPINLGLTLVSSPTCEDGIMNGTETAIDCGGTSCQDCSIACPYQLLFEEDFENGYGIWKNGGADCRRSHLDSLYATSGKYCIRIRDNSFHSKVSSNAFDLSNYDNIRLDFNYMTRSMDNPNEDFYLQISLDGGSSFSVLKNWNKGDEFENNVRYQESVEITGPFSNQTVFRFRCDASGYNDWVYLDDIKIYGCQTPSARIELESLDDLKSIQFLSTYPSPFTNQLQIEINSLSKTTNSLQLIDLKGNTLIHKVVNLYPGNNLFSVNTNKIPNGIYFLMLQSEEIVMTKKIVKMK